METNMGKIDAGIRWIMAAVFFGISLAFNQSQVLALIAAVVAVIMVATALTRSCPIYWALGIGTCPQDSSAPRQTRRLT